MVEFSCPKCNRSFNKKSTYLTHVNRKTDCVEGDGYFYRREKPEAEQAENSVLFNENPMVAENNI